MKKNHTVEVGVRLNDKISDPMRRISRETRKMSGDLKSIGTFMGAFTNNLDIAARRLDGLANSMFRFNMYASGITRTMRNIGLIAGGAAIGLGVSATKSAMDFEFKTHKMQIRMGVNDKVRKDVEDYILNELNYQAMYTPSQIADIGIVLGQAGIGKGEDMKQLLKTVTYFSEATDAIPDQAAELLVSSIKGFNKSIEDSTSITDKFVVAVNKSLLHVEELPHAVGQLAGRANALGQTLDSSLVALMSGADQGMSAAQMSQNFLHGLRQLSLAGRDDILWPRRRSFYEKLGIDTSFFDLETKQLKEFPEIIESMEKTLANQGMMPNKEEFYRIIEENGGLLPDDIINKMESMPLMSRVFGNSGQMPILMGLQTRYQETDEDGNAIGPMLYGSDALKAMREAVENSQGEIQKAHDKMAETAQYKLGVLAGAWQAAQLRIVDGFLPSIKVAEEELTNFLAGKNVGGALDRFNTSIQESAVNLRTINPMLGDMVETLGDIAVNAVRIGSDALPAVFSEVNDAAYKNLTTAEWGDSLLTFPYHAVKNSMGFMVDLFDNEKSDEAISELPKELQDEASLVRGFIKGGLAVVAASAIVKILELALRSISLGVKGIKGIATLGTLLINAMFGTAFGKGGMLGKLTGMTVHASVVNVYGGVVNNGLPGPGGPKVVTPPPAKLPWYTRFGQWLKRPAIGGATTTGGVLTASTAAVTFAGLATYLGIKNQENSEKERQEKEEMKEFIQSVSDEGLSRRAESIHRNMANNRNPEKAAKDIIMAQMWGDKADTLKELGHSDYFKNLNERINDPKYLNLNFAPQIVISGELKDKINVEVKHDKYQEVLRTNEVNDIYSKRFPMQNY